MNRADIFKIFDVELNITIFLGALVATFRFCCKVEFII